MSELPTTVPDATDSKNHNYNSEQTHTIYYCVDLYSAAGVLQTAGPGIRRHNHRAIISISKGTLQEPRVSLNKLIIDLSGRSLMHSHKPYGYKDITSPYLAVKTIVKNIF